MIRIERTHRFIGVVAFGLWLALAIVVAVKAVQRPGNHSTFPIFRHASLAWWDGVNVYDSDVFADDYRYGPAFAMVMGPIAWLPLRIGAVLWAVMNVGLAFSAIRVLARRVLPGMQSPTAQHWLLIASIFPSAHCLYSSQTNLLVFALVVYAAIAILDGRWWLAALLLAIPIHIKVWPLAAALLLTTCWPRRLAWRLPIALAAVAALPLLVKPPGWVFTQYVQWYQHLLGPDLIRHSYRDAWTIWELIASEVDPGLYLVLQLSTAAAVLGLCLWQAGRASGQGKILFVLASWTAWQLVFGPGTERNTFALIAPLTGWAIAFAIMERRGRWLMAGSYFLTVISALRGVENLFPVLKVLHPVGVMLFFGWYLGCFLSWKFRAAGESEPANWGQVIYRRLHWPEPGLKRGLELGLDRASPPTGREAVAINRLSPQAPSCVPIDT